MENMHTNARVWRVKRDQDQHSSLHLSDFLKEHSQIVSIISARLHTFSCCSIEAIKHMLITTKKKSNTNFLLAELTM